MKLLFPAVGLAACWFLAGCSSTPVFLTTNPPGATTLVNTAAVGTTPVQVSLDPGKNNFVHFELANYFPEDLTIPQGSVDKQFSVDLAPSRISRSYEIATDPAGASIAIDGNPVGTSPAQITVVYTRDAKDSPWIRHRLTISLDDYQAETYRLSQSIPAIGLIQLGRIRVDRIFRLSAVTRNGDALQADVLLDGRPVGKTPMDLPITFQRPAPSNPWPRFTVAVRVPGEYQQERAALAVATAADLRFTLAPISEITTTQVVPRAVMTPTGITWTMTQRQTVAVLDPREASEAVEEITPVTNFTRQDLAGSANTRVESINSFTVSPDGQNVIFALTLSDADGDLYSNLFLKRADGAAGGVSQLTEGTQYIDTEPTIANDGSNYLVFTSNRADRTKPDIFRSNLIDDSLSGGIARLTNDLRFNFCPTYGESNRQVFYLSVEPNYPLAETELSSIRINGSLPTLLSVTALQINNSVPDKVYFVQLDKDTGKRQIYSIQADGSLETAIINQDNLRASNCFDPAPSPDGNRIAFVSDVGVDDHRRHNNDLYVMNADGTGLLRLTRNGSDDIEPVWSPSESGVLYFLSNRGGAYNIWRMKLRNAAPPPASRPQQ